MGSIINPIDDQEEIISEAKADVPQFTPVADNLQQDSKPDGSTRYLSGLKDEPLFSTAPRIPKLPPEPLIPHTGIKPSANKSDKALFKYPLPVFSYVLSWLYLVGVFVFLVIALGSSAYDTVVYPCLFASATGAAIMISLLIPKLIFRYVALAMSLLLCGYQVIMMYGLIDYIIKNHETLLSTVLNSGTMFLVVAPYTLLPIVTVICLFSSKASRAYI
jgi:hypothetical protein